MSSMAKLTLETSEFESSLIKEEADFNWVIIENHLYDISEFPHPKGKFIIDNCCG